MAVHVLKERLGVSDNDSIRITYGGKGGGAPQSCPSNAFPRLFGDCHVVNLLVEKVSTGVFHYIIKDLLITREPCVLVRLLGEVAKRGPPACRVGGVFRGLCIAIPGLSDAVVELVKNVLDVCTVNRLSDTLLDASNKGFLLI